MASPEKRRRPRDDAAPCARDADVLIENFKAGTTAKRYGIDYAALAATQSAPRVLLDHGLRPDRTAGREQPGYDFPGAGHGRTDERHGCQRDGVPGGGPQKVGVALTRT
jgi:crotonobetainyl-CoA:carnitine CoA-transferase CaiB-like acyl-CoA transferase